MDYSIRLLSEGDLPYFEAMDNGIEEDYIKRIFNRLVSGDNRLYGLFLEDQLASVCGYSIFAKRYAMLGRVRSDIHYRGKDLATKLSSHIIDEAFSLPQIQWVGANTQEKNAPARRVLEKIGLSEQVRLFAATTDDISMLESSTSLWREVHALDRKKAWVDELYVKTGAVFPYECYYLFPASRELFPEDKLAGWSFFENPEGDRVLITKQDIKGATYLHTIYPWPDVMEQDGLWETVANEYQRLKTSTKEGETFVWMDLDEEAVHTLPENHPFKLSSPWVLYGIEREPYMAKKEKANELSSL